MKGRGYRGRYHRAPRGQDGQRWPGALGRWNRRFRGAESPKVGLGVEVALGLGVGPALEQSLGAESDLPLPCGKGQMGATDITESRAGRSRQAMRRQVFLPLPLDSNDQEETKSAPGRRHQRTHRL